MDVIHLAPSIAHSDATANDLKFPLSEHKRNVHAIVPVYMMLFCFFQVPTIDTASHQIPGYRRHKSVINSKTVQMIRTKLIAVRCAHLTYKMFNYQANMWSNSLSDGNNDASPLSCTVHSPWCVPRLGMSSLLSFASFSCRALSLIHFSQLKTVVFNRAELGIASE